MAELSTLVFFIVWCSSVSDAAVNIALNKPAVISSVQTAYGGGPAENAVDGNLTSEIHSLESRLYAWWKVDLQTQVTDAVIIVYFRTIWPFRRPGLRFYVSQTPFPDPTSDSWSPPAGVQLVHTTTGSYRDIPDKYTIQTTGEWRYLLVYTITNYRTYGAALDFKELQVMACNQGFYGINCGNRCDSRGCEGSSPCPHDTGKCADGCTTGFTRSDCSPCMSGTYGDECVKQCDDRGCSGTSSCYHVTGKCDQGCRSGYSGDDCYKCSSGFYSSTCNKDCSERNCDNDGTPCSRSSFSCPCAAGWTGSECKTPCTHGFYGKDCKVACSSRLCATSPSPCNASTGECSGGCRAGYRLPDCATACELGSTYGVNCSKRCDARNCQHSQACDTVAGRCWNDLCKPGWKIPDCATECDAGTYGDRCGQTCSSRNCLTASDTCDHVTGRCPNGCAAGWEGINCRQECPDGQYGLNCSKECSNRRCTGSVFSCDKATGECTDGCQDGWSGIDCTSQCPPGMYLDDCSKKCGDRNCKGETSSCPLTDGRCDTGCAVGWASVDCTTRCPSGFYGNCSARCGKCLNGPICHHVTGVCPSGCELGVKPDLCIEECSVGTYGRHCVEQCGNCNGTCDVVTGMCPEGCLDGFQGDLCVKKVVKLSPVPVGAIAGAVVGVLVVVIVVVVIIVVLRRKKNRNENKLVQGSADFSKDENVYVNVAATDVRDSHNLTEKQTINHMKNNISGFGKEDEISSKPKMAVKPTKQKSVEDTENKPKPKVAVKPIKQKSLADNDTDEEVQEEESRSTDVYYNQTEEDPIREIAVPELADTVKKVQGRENGFLAEYRRLPTGFTASYEDSQKPENGGKNKFKGYYPYDHNRVKLQPIPDTPGSDYINASFMQSYNSKKTYIAAQAANKKTVDDFWRMIWEHKCNRIVMLTGLMEDSKVKCEKYWPDEEIKHMDHFEVQTQNTEIRADYTIRHLKVTSKTTKEQRTVVHYHYTTWPDHGVPNTLSLVKFIWHIRRTDTDSDGPLLVHCSAGIGRTGTYIAVDSLYDQARDEGKVDVPAYVAEMRTQRKNMIQTHDQYECVFLCLVEMTTYGDTSLSSSDFYNIYNNRGMDAEVDGRSLKQLAEKTLSEPYATDSHRMWVDGNQKFVVKHSSSFSHPKGMLLAATPDPSLTKLLWKLVEENDVHTVLAVSPLQGEIIGSLGQNKQFGNIAVATKKTESLDTDLSAVTLELTERHEELGDARTVKLYKVKNPVTMETLSSLLINQTEIQRFSTDSRKVVILHSDVDTRNAVLFCIMCNILGEIMVDSRVDVISHVRKYHQYFPEAKITQVDVKTLHDVVYQHLQTTDSSNMYANL